MQYVGGIMPTELAREDLGHLAYLHRVLAQPLDRWEGFYTPQADAMNFGLRFQVAFAAYAVAALALRTPAYRRPYAAALLAACERMRDVRVWGYWRRPPAAEAPDPQTSGHLAVLLTPHQRRPLGPPADPIHRNNVQFSGHFGTVLGLYERLTGDRRYDVPFVLGDPASGVAYEYTHSQVAARLVAQMGENYFGGVCCEDGVAYVACNNHALTANALHDATHGTDYDAARVGWLEWVRHKMVLKGPALRGLFATCYLRDMHLSTPVAFNFTDAWGLAFLLPFDPALVRRLYPRLRRKLTGAGRAGMFLGSAPLTEKMEISDVPLNTAFALIVARGVGDTRTAARLAGYAHTHFGHRWDGPALRYADAPRTLHTTALYALAQVAEQALLHHLFHAPHDIALDTQPILDRVTAGADAVGVARAEYDPTARTLHLALERLGPDPAGPPLPVALECTQVPGVRAVQRPDGPAPDWMFDPATRRLTVQTALTGRQEITVRVGG
jgi:hypothetical protein